MDFVPRGSGAYTYWENGALKSDENEQISNITYHTFLNQPEQVTLSDGRWIKYNYDGSGALIKTEYSTGEYWEFAGGLVYKNGAFYQIAIPEGRAIYQGGNWQMEFDYKDHLGNTRVSFKADGTSLVNASRSDFDPWGVLLKTGQENSYQNRFEIQGKESEKTFGLNRINFGARTYNATIGRFDRIDELSEKYLSLSPFNYVANNPVNAIDIDGRDIILIKSDSKNNRGNAYNYSYGSLSTKTSNALNKILTTSEGYNYFAQFAKAGQEVAGFKFKQDGRFSDVKFNIVDYSMANESGNVTISMDGSLVHRALNSGKVDITLSLLSFGTGENSLVETIAHEIGGHGYKTADLMKAYENGGIKGFKELQGKFSNNGNDDHRALRDKDVKHPGYKSYTKIRKELKAIFKNRFEDTFNEELKYYERKYKELD